MPIEVVGALDDDRREAAALGDELRHLLEHRLFLPARAAGSTSLPSVTTRNCARLMA